jgi:glyoxylate carboligase
MNGLYDAHYDGAPVLAITGTTFHDLIGTRFMQGVDTVKLMEPLAELNVQITGPPHALIVVNRACRTALGNRCVAHVTVPKDLQAMKLSADKPSMENHGLRTSESWSPVASAPDAQQLQAAANILNAGKRVAILAGQGALATRADVQRIAETLGAPVAKALLGKAVLPDDSPYTTDGIGHLGTQPSQRIMHRSILWPSPRSAAQTVFDVRRPLSCVRLLQPLSDRPKRRSSKPWSIPASRQQNRKKCGYEKFYPKEFYERHQENKTRVLDEAFGRDGPDS